MLTRFPKHPARISAFALVLFAAFSSHGQEAPAPALAETEEALTLSIGDQPVLVYHKAEVPPPDGVDPVFTRSGFIHPLHAPGGGVVTGIHPADHYHHLGLWHAWVKAEYDGKPVDFWNLKGRTGLVRFVKVLERRAAGFTVEQEQAAYLAGPDAEAVPILRESLAVDVARVDGAHVIDYRIAQKNVAAQPLVLPAYRYGGGLAYRAPHSWNRENSDYLTSEGLTRVDSHATRVRWCAMWGPAEGGKRPSELATVAILCHPANRDAPQRVRTWDSGEVFFNYVPIQETGWEIKPGETVELVYRLVILDGRATREAIEARWQAFAKD
ncbi:MAG: PmoA family protein [Verrucomicrobiales bacterium]|nr:PmoA family protein [Verrucomicrobiales bacterium]